MTRLEDLLTVTEAAAAKGVSPDTVRRRIQRKALPAILKGNIWLIRRKDLEAWTVQRKRSAQTQGEDDAG